MSLRMSREKAEAWMEYFADQDEKEYNNYIEYLDKLDDNCIKMIAEEILNKRKDSHKLIPTNMHPDRNYLSIDGVKRFKKALHKAIQSRDMRVIYTVEKRKIPEGGNSDG